MNYACDKYIDNFVNFSVFKYRCVLCKMNDKIYTNNISLLRILYKVKIKKNYVKSSNLFLYKYNYLHCSLKFCLHIFCVVYPGFRIKCFLIACICMRGWIYFFVFKCLKKIISACTELDIYLKNSVISVYLYMCKL